MKNLAYSILPLLICGIFLNSCKQVSSKQHPGPLYHKVLPGSSELDMSRLESQRVRYSKFRGKMIYNLEMAEATSNNYKLFIDFKVNGKEAPDTVYFSSETLAFSHRWFYNAFSDYTGQLRIEDDTLVGSIVPGNNSSLSESIIYNKALPHPVFEPAMLHYALSCLPLKEGYTASLPMLELNAGGKIIWANIEVVAKESLRANGKRHQVWKILSNGSRNKTFWLSVDSPVFIKMKNDGVRFKWRYKGHL